MKRLFKSCLNAIILLACASVERAAAAPTVVVYNQTQSTVDGQPFLPKGVYAANPVDFARAAGYGYNIVQSYQLTGMTDSAVTSYLDQAQQNGLKVLFHLGAAVPTPAVVTQVKARIQMFKDHPAMYAWYLADEPNTANTNHADLKSLYDWIKANDPNHPVFSSNWQLGTFKDCCDVDMPQLYSGAPSRQRTSALPGRLQQSLQDGEPWIAIANTYEGFGGAGPLSLSPANLLIKNADGTYQSGLTEQQTQVRIQTIAANLANPPYADPLGLPNTPAAVRGQAFAMIAHGSNGVFHWLLQPENSINTTFGYYTIYPRQPLRDMMRTTMQELDTLWPRISAPAQGASTWYDANTGNVFFWCRRVGTQVTVIAINESETPATLRVPIPSLAKAASVTAVVNGENRSITVQNGYLNDTFQANEAHVYLIDNAGVDTDTDGVWTNAAGGSWPTTGNWSGGVSADGIGKTADFSTLNLTSNATVTLDGDHVLSVLKFADTTASHDWALNAGSGGMLTLAGTASMDVANRSATIGAVITGQGFQKTGGGTLNLAGANTYKGATTVAAGTLSVSGNQSSADGGWNINAGTANLQSGSTVAVASGKSVSLANTVTSHALNVSGTVANSGSLTMGGASTLTINSGGSWSQSGAMSLAPVWSYATARIKVNTGGLFTYTGGTTIPLKSSNSTTGVTDKSFVTLSGGTFVTGCGFTNPIVGGAGSAGLEFSAGGILKLGDDIAVLATTADRPFTVQIGTGGGVIDTNGFSTTVTQGIDNISGQTGALTKLGAGTLTLSGTNGYTGTTTVSGGTLSITGSLGNGAVTIQNSATLGGSGTIGGAMSVQTGGSLAPSGVLTVNNTLTLAGSAQVALSKTGSTLANDKVSGISTVTYGGSLVVTHLGPDPLAAGDSFQLFGATAYSGTFGLTLPLLAPNLVWDTSKLSVNGTIAVRALPLAVNDSATKPEDNAATIAVLANDSDADGDTLSIQSVTQGANGSVAIAGSNVTYSPAANWSGTDTFQYTVTNGRNGTATATVTVTITPVNDAPAFTVNPIGKPNATEDSAYTNTIAGSATDVDAGDTLTYSKTSGPAWLSVAANGAISGTPSNSDVGANSFTVKVSDAAGANATATLNITVINVNDAPVFTANPISGSGATEDAAYSGTLAGTASDVDAGDSLTYSKVSGPAWLNVASNGALSGTPLNSNVGANSFTVKVADAAGGNATTTLNITVANVNDAPMFAANPISGSGATEDTAYSATLAGTAIDVDAGDSLTYSKVSGPAWLSVAANGAISGTPDNSDVGANSFTVKVTDVAGANATATLNITVINVNDAPAFTSNPINLSATEDSAFSGQLAATDIDAGDTLTYSKVSGVAWLTVSGSGALSGTPANGDIGANAFTVRVTDAAGAFANATLNITVANSNDAPVFAVDPILAADASEGVAYTGQTLAGSATDVDAGDTLAYSKVSGPAWLNVAANGALTGTPPSGSAGLNTFVVRVTDGGFATDEAELRVNVASLPLPWDSVDIGTGMLAGSAIHSAGTFTQAGSGALGGTSDKLRYIYQSITGDGEIIARISSLQDTGNSSRVGVMFRESLAANSRQVFMGLTSNGNYRWVRRGSTGGNNSTSNSSTGTVPNTWVRLVRSGNTVTAYKSSNGTSWTTVGSTTATLGTNCYVGLAVSSGSNTTLNTSQFSNVSVTP